MQRTDEQELEADADANAGEADTGEGERDARSVDGILGDRVAGRVFERGSADESERPPARSDPGGGIRARVRSRANSVFALRPFLGALAVSVGALLGASLLFASGPPGSVTGLASVFVAGFALGVAGWRRYLEVALAGATAAAVGTVVLNPLMWAVSGTGAVTLLGAGSGTVAAVLGHYFGRDLREGLTREVSD